VALPTSFLSTTIEEVLSGLANLRTTLGVLFLTGSFPEQRN
jgi:hypothetical protein